jgi:hypothetical protein
MNPLLTIKEAAAEPRVSKHNGCNIGWWGILSTPPVFRSTSHGKPEEI